MSDNYFLSDHPHCKSYSYHPFRPSSLQKLFLPSFQTILIAKAILTTGHMYNPPMFPVPPQGPIPGHGGGEVVRIKLFPKMYYLNFTTIIFTSIFEKFLCTWSSEFCTGKNVFTTDILSTQFLQDRGHGGIWKSTATSRTTIKLELKRKINLTVKIF